MYVFSVKFKEGAGLLGSVVAYEKRIRIGKQTRFLKINRERKKGRSKIAVILPLL